MGKIVKRVHLDKESFVIEKDGYPVAAITDIDEFDEITNLNAQSASFDFLKDEPDLYTLSDLKRHYV